MTSWLATSWVPSGEPSSTMMSSQSRLLEGHDVSCRLPDSHAPCAPSIGESATHFSENVRCSSQVMMGRFCRSLKVGRITE